MARKKTIFCRFEGCKHKGFTSRAGRLYHERTKHGQAFSKKTPPDKPHEAINPHIDPKEKTEVSRQNTFVEVTDVKFNMAKNTKEVKDNKEYENECGKCGHEFNGASKFCPECGVEFA